MSRLPKAEDAIIDDDKIIKYLLSETHPIGSAKAKYFKNLGFTAEAAEQFRKALRRHAMDRTIVEQEKNSFGEKFVVRCEIEAPRRVDRCINTVWILLKGSTAPKLVTAYPA